MENNHVSPSSTQPLDSLFITTNPPPFLGSASMVSFEDVKRGKRSEKPVFCPFNDDNNVDEEYEEYFHRPEKKRRLTADQVHFLEKSFEIENKLEPERKVQLAKDLGLQPRQVAIWFQNRRARWKTKQLEKDYNVLQSSYNSLKTDYESLLKEKEKLTAEVLDLSDKLLLQQKKKTDLEKLAADRPPDSPLQGPTDELTSKGEASENPAVVHKLKDAIVVTKDGLESDIPHCTDRDKPSPQEAGETSSDISQDEEDNSDMNMLASSLYVFPKHEDAYYPDPPTYSCYYEFPIEDQAFGIWPY